MGERALHGLAPDGSGAYFGIGLWPYDVLLRFGYDLPENEHMWGEGEWFDDTYEAAAFALRSDASKLVLAIRAMDGAVSGLAAASGDDAAKDLVPLREAVRTAPLALDLVVAYLSRIRDGLAAILPCCYGADGKVLQDARAAYSLMSRCDALGNLDGEMKALLDEASSLAVQANRRDLYVIGENEGFGVALPRAAARNLRASAATTIAAAGEIDRLVAAECAWLDRVVARLQGVVAERAEDGPGLLERWADRDWARIMPSPNPDPAANHLPAI